MNNIRNAAENLFLAYLHLDPNWTAPFQETVPSAISSSSIIIWSLSITSQPLILRRSISANTASKLEISGEQA